MISSVPHAGALPCVGERFLRVWLLSIHMPMGPVQKDDNTIMMKAWSLTLGT
jgi:hypothetical protein